MVISEAKGHDDLCLIMERQEVSDSASFRPRQLFNSGTTASARRRDVGHDQRRPNVGLSLSRVTRHNLLMGKARTPASTSKTANKSSSGKAGGTSSGKGREPSSGDAPGPSSGDAPGPSSGTALPKDKVRIAEGKEEEPSTSWMRGPSIELGFLEGAHWRWTLYPNTLKPDDGETMYTYGLVVWNEAFHVELVKRAAGKPGKTITVSDIHALSQDKARDVLLEAWFLPLVSSIT